MLNFPGKFSETPSEMELPPPALGEHTEEIFRELGITKGLLWKWIESFEKSTKKEEVFPGNGRMPDTEAHIQQLERENRQLRQDKDILKKVLEMFSTDGR